MPKPIPGQEKYRKYKSIEDIFADTLIMPNGCIEWQKGKDNYGYGKTHFDGKNRPTHRLVLELLIGKRDSKTFVLHSCDNPPCINPAHLRYGSAKDNSNDIDLRGRRNTLRGSKSKSARITEEDALLIRYMYKNRIMSVQNMELIFPIKKISIYHIIYRITWKHV